MPWWIQTPGGAAAPVRLHPTAPRPWWRRPVLAVVATGGGCAECGRRVALQPIASDAVSDAASAVVVVAAVASAGGCKC